MAAASDDSLYTVTTAKFEEGKKLYEEKKYYKAEPILTDVTQKFLELMTSSSSAPIIKKQATEAIGMLEKIKQHKQDIIASLPPAPTSTPLPSAPTHTPQITEQEKILQNFRALEKPTVVDVLKAVSQWVEWPDTQNPEEVTKYTKEGIYLIKYKLLEPPTPYEKMGIETDPSKAALLRKKILWRNRLKSLAIKGLESRMRKCGGCPAFKGKMVFPTGGYKKRKTNKKRRRTNKSKKSRKSRKRVHRVKRRNTRNTRKHKRCHHRRR